MTKKGDDEESQGLWSYVTRDVKPLKRRAVTSAPPGTKKKVFVKEEPPVPMPKTGNQKSADVDRRTDERLRRGQMPFDARIDLHGMGQAEAQETLERFLVAGYHHGRRCVLVITGKGREGKGILRAQVPQWLGEGALAGIVLRFYPAKPQHGGQGAFYVLLRRRRD